MNHLLVNAFKYKQWADRRTLDAVARLAENAPAADAFARQQLNHMVIVEELFKARLLGVIDPHPATNTETLPQLQELDNRLTHSGAWFAHYVKALDRGHWEEVEHFQFADGKRGAMTRQEILFHIVNHGTYHRGAIGHALDLAGAPRPADTYSEFIHSVEPSRRGQVN